MLPDWKRDVQKTTISSCALCGLENDKKICMSAEGMASKGCPTVNRKEVLVEANKEYEVQETSEFARQATIQEAECYANRHHQRHHERSTSTR